MSYIPKGTTLDDLRTMAYSALLLAMSTICIPPQITDNVIDGYWNRHVTDEAERSCRAEFGYVSDQLTFPMSEDIVISATEFSNCFEQKVEELNAGQEISNKDYFLLAAAVFLAGFGVLGIGSSAASIHQRRESNKALKLS